MSEKAEGPKEGGSDPVALAAAINRSSLEVDTELVAYNMWANANTIATQDFDLGLRMEVVIDNQSLVAYNAGRRLRIGRQLGIETPPLDTGQIEKFCDSNYEDYRSYMRSLEPRN